MLLSDMKPAPMSMDTSETANSYEVVLDLPGFEKGDIKATIANHRLTISAVRKNRPAKFLTRERINGEFGRSIGKENNINFLEILLMKSWCSLAKEHRRQESNSNIQRRCLEHLGTTLHLNNMQRAILNIILILV